MESGRQYRYFIFLDDDVRFIRGDYQLFEKRHKLYGEATLQFNEVAVANDVHRAYPTNDARAAQTAWFSDQFVEAISDPRRSAANLLSLQGIRYAMGQPSAARCLVSFVRAVRSTLGYRRVAGHRLASAYVRSVLRPDSELLAQYAEADGQDRP
jgi:hypothetical protein